MLINDIKSGMRVSLRGGGLATVKDNKKGMTRLIEVETSQGKDTGSEYAFNFIKVEVGSKWEEVTMTPDQQKQAQKIKVMLGALHG